MSRHAGSNKIGDWKGRPDVPTIVIAEKYDVRADCDDFIFQLSSLFLGRGFDGLIGEVLVYDRELEHDERRHILHYLSTKWKIEM